MRVPEDDRVESSLRHVLRRFLERRAHVARHRRVEQVAILAEQAADMSVSHHLVLPVPMEARRVKTAQKAEEPSQSMTKIRATLERRVYRWPCSMWMRLPPELTFR